MPRKQKEPGEAASAYLTQKALRAQLIIPCKGKTTVLNQIKAAAPTAQGPSRVLIHAIPGSSEQPPDIPEENIDRDTRETIFMAQASESSATRTNLKRPASGEEETGPRNLRKPRISTQIIGWQPGTKTKWVRVGHSKWNPCLTGPEGHTPEPQQEVEMALTDGSTDGRNTNTTTSNTTGPYHKTKEEIPEESQQAATSQYRRSSERQETPRHINHQV